MSILSRMILRRCHHKFDEPPGDASLTLASGLAGNFLSEISQKRWFAIVRSASGRPLSVYQMASCDQLVQKAYQARIPTITRFGVHWRGKMYQSAASQRSGESSASPWSTDANPEVDARIVNAGDTVSDRFFILSLRRAHDGRSIWRRCVCDRQESRQ